MRRNRMYVYVHMYADIRVYMRVYESGRVYLFMYVCTKQIV